jgi:hypothetical protein
MNDYNLTENATNHIPYNPCNDRILVLLICSRKILVDCLVTDHNISFRVVSAQHSQLSYYLKDINNEVEMGR